MENDLSKKIISCPDRLTCVYDKNDNKSLKLKFFRNKLNRLVLFVQTSRICRTGSTSWLQFAKASSQLKTCEASTSSQSRKPSQSCDYTSSQSCDDIRNEAEDDDFDEPKSLSSTRGRTRTSLRSSNQADLPPLPKGDQVLTASFAITAVISYVATSSRGIGSNPSESHVKASCHIRSLLSARTITILLSGL
ncbi:hypothetical protein RhiirA4_419242 [Rhizophagus irregularis]|uniref:Uncharacterized protein n=1 Tax=Rhizophagus irregularis TaxID=588596 RepID=A0A2I1GDK1_9GLOM|nr:hypothetical protein RhiirA4_419242 [Rhizophagus irregularis]